MLECDYRRLVRVSFFRLLFLLISWQKIIGLCDFVGKKRQTTIVFCFDLLQSWHPIQKSYFSRLSEKIWRKRFFFKKKRKIKPVMSLEKSILDIVHLTLSWQRPLSYRNQSIDLLHFHDRYSVLMYNSGLKKPEWKPLLLTSTKSVICQI